MPLAHAYDSQRDTTEDLDLPDLERTFIVMAGADAAFDFLSDPVRLPDYVPTLRLEESIAIDGAADADTDEADRVAAPEAGFTADRATRHIAWGRPGEAYGGSIDVAEGTTNTSSVTVRVRTRDQADPDAVIRLFDETVANIRRLVSRR